ncbi:hypothetical protein [Aureimonas pseudogalii]|uniref:Uncharacterized protein n=1 Tax=Aureimonas pseudogalii TaxID=1744844 RepID=A0A7W6H4R1_9HYPH|nr:hypothetical protein [Aureimonas pseudogalii]MBB3997819.1 hypothetical protein [Aureimonas pseudogalii]
MPTFGFSAFLKLISLSPRRQKSEIQKRLQPSKNGYDFHRNLKLHAHRYLYEGTALEDVLASVSRIVKDAEKRSTAQGLARLHTWRSENLGDLIEFPPAIYESPRGRFKVKFTSDIGIADRGGMAIHIWNTASPGLNAREIFAALALMNTAYRNIVPSPASMAVLSLRNSQLYRLTDAEDFSLIGRRVVESLEGIFEDVEHGVQLPRDDRPIAPSQF